MVLTGRRTEVLQELATELNARSLAADLSDPAEVERLTEEAGAVDILIANAALPASGRIETYTEKEIERALQTNLAAPIAMAHRLVPAMLARGGGHLVFISSLAGKAATPGAPLYSATEARTPRLRILASHRPARNRSGSLGDLPGIHQRCGHVRRRAHRAPARRGYAHSAGCRAGRRCARCWRTAGRSTSPRRRCASARHSRGSHRSSPQAPRDVSARTRSPAPTSSLSARCAEHSSPPRPSSRRQGRARERTERSPPGPGKRVSSYPTGGNPHTPTGPNRSR